MSARKLLAVLSLAYLTLGVHPIDTQRVLSLEHADKQASTASLTGDRLEDIRWGREYYEGHQVLRVDWERLDKAVKEEVLQAMDLLNLDVWRSTPKHLDVRIPPHHIPLFTSYLPSETSYRTIISDLQQLIDVSTPASVYTTSNYDLSLSTPWHDAYHSLLDLYSFGSALVGEFPDMLEEFVVGRSSEGRGIMGYRAHIHSEGVEEGARGTKGKKGKKGKKEQGSGGVIADQNLEFIVQSGQHAREWIGPSTSMYFLHSILTSARDSPDGEMVKLLKSFTFTVIPTVNPDGYVFSHDHSRMWRKNRQDVGDKLCLGVDLNSNWGYKWRHPKSSVCSDTYPGRWAFDSPETRAVGWYLANGTMPDESAKEGTTSGRRVRAFIDLHSYGQLFMFPFAVSCDDFPPDAEMLMEAGLGVAKAMRNRKGEGYQAGQACDLTYRAPGDAIDYAYGVTDVRWSYSAELRDTGTYGFMLPPHLIRPAAEEVSDGLLYLARFIYNAEIAG